MSSSDKDFDKELPRSDEPLVGDWGKDIDNIEIDPVPTPQPEDMPGIAVHRPEDVEKRGPRFNPMHTFRRWVGRRRGYYPVDKRKRAITVAAATVAGLLVLFVGVPFVWLQCNKLPDIRLLENYTPVQAITIYDRFDKVAAVVAGDEDRRPVKLSQVSPLMKLSMIGAEDHDFYHHGGINPSSIMRAMIKNLQAGRIVEGGSTITQQLVKNLFFPSEQRTFNRKIKEFFLANQVDAKYPKDKILEMYLNQIYFGNLAYGIEAAAQRHFNKPASKLTLGESAFLAGLVRAPSYLANPQHRDAAFARQHQVLDQMVEYGMISKTDAENAKAEKLAFRKFVSPYQKFPFYVSFIVEQLREHYGEQELQHGLKVYTYLDPVAQAQAEKALNDGIAHAPSGVTQGALVSLHVSDGGVIALVGGAGKFEDHQWNRAVQPHTMGSSFKPFVYLTGFLKGLTPDSIVLDSPFSAPSGGQVYSPRNFDNSFMGAMTIKKALTFSRNVAAVRIAWFSGIKNVINTARLAGITSRLDPYLPTAIGACAASSLEMAGAYATIARGGVYLTPHLVRRIDNPDGKTIYTYDEKPKKVFPSTAVAELIDCMQNVVQHGTGIYAQLPGRLVAGKTGTADKSRDIWFIGFTPDTCTALWGGNDHNKAINNRSVTGGMVMAGMWKKYMVAYYDARPTPPGSFLLPTKDQVEIAMDTADANRARSQGITPVGATVEDKAKLAAKPAAGADSAEAATAADASNSAQPGTDSDKSYAARAKRRKAIARKLDSESKPAPAAVPAADEAVTSPAAPTAERDNAENAKPAVIETTVKPEEKKSEPAAEKRTEKAEAPAAAPAVVAHPSAAPAPAPLVARPHRWHRAPAQGQPLTQDMLIPIGGGRAMLVRVPVRSRAQARIMPRLAPALVAAPIDEDGGSED
jgi:1A family penicillin-binding protein